MRKVFEPAVSPVTTVEALACSDELFALLMPHETASASTALPGQVAVVPDAFAKLAHAVSVLPPIAMFAVTMTSTRVPVVTVTTGPVVEQSAYAVPLRVHVPVI
jgi:hypothetical protein